MNQKFLTFDQRVRNLEKALLSFIFLSTSFIAISNPSSIPKIFGIYGVIIYLGIFLLSYTLTIYYSLIIGVSIAFDATNKTIALIVKNKKIVALIIIGFLISTSVASLNYLGYTLEQIIGGVVLALLVSVIVGYKKIYDSICDIISKVEKQESKENIR